MQFDRINAYRVMWVFVFFDLPTETKPERKAHAQFRKELMKDGFTMMQFSVYVRHCASAESAEAHIRRVKAFMPKKGHVSILRITDKQYGDILNIWGAKTEPLESPPAQLEFF
ncbi:CRISPR-associated endonuclease Cas2 [bacterium]|nr:CRISPR-associated endonuclease Cas2 [bacterium]NUN44595.1 CRISPR-associated endonuclease Cas2 [bacterium]